MSGHEGDEGYANRVAYSAVKLVDLARRLDVAGRSTMNKKELAEAVNKANQKANAAARKR